MTRTALTLSGNYHSRQTLKFLHARPSRFHVLLPLLRTIPTNRRRFRALRLHSNTRFLYVEPPTGCRHYADDLLQRHLWFLSIGVEVEETESDMREASDLEVRERMSEASVLIS